MLENIEKLLIDYYLDKFEWWDKLPLNWKQIFINLIDGKRLFEIELENICTYTLHSFSDRNILFTLFGSSKKYPLSRNCKPFKVYGEIEMIYFFNKLFKRKELNLNDSQRFNCGEILDFCIHFNQLETINLNNTQISHLNGIENLVYLKRLEIISTNISDIQELVNLKNLEVLKFSYKNCSNHLTRFLYDNEIQTELNDRVCFDISFLSELRELRELYFPSIFAKNFTSLRFLNKLEILYLKDSNVHDLSVLKNLKRLKKLNLSGVNLEDIKDLVELENIEELDISENIEISNISILTSFQKLKYLNLSNTNAINLQPISSLFNLNILVLNGLRNRNIENHYDIYNEICFSDISQSDYDKFYSWSLNLNPIKQLSSLKELYISNTDVSDFSVLNGLINLEVLDMSGLYIKNLKCISNLRKLKKLILYDVHGLKSKEIENFKQINDDIQIYYSLAEEYLNLSQI